MKHRELRRRHTAPTPPPWSPYALGVIWGSLFAMFFALAVALVLVLSSG